MLAISYAGTYWLFALFHLYAADYGLSSPMSLNGLGLHHEASTAFIAAT
jgi:hypothetical protein